MPKPVLNKDSVGFFGKLPATGDFVARGLPQGLRPFLDQWLTRNFAHRARTPDDWPTDGYRAIVKWGEKWLVLLILPSHDKARREFPLSVCRTTHCAPDRTSADIWCDIVFDLARDAIEHVTPADVLIQSLALLENTNLIPEANPKEDSIWS